MWLKIHLTFWKAMQVTVEIETAYIGRLLPGSGGLSVLKFPDPIENNLNE